MKKIEKNTVICAMSSFKKRISYKSGDFIRSEYIKYFRAPDMFNRVRVKPQLAFLETRLTRRATRARKYLSSSDLIKSLLL